MNLIKIIIIIIIILLLIYLFFNKPVEITKKKINKNKNKKKKVKFNDNIKYDTYNIPSETPNIELSLNEKDKFMKKIILDNEDYQNAISSFTKYQTANNIIETNTTIDPFENKGKTIQEIYDKQVAPPKLNDELRGYDKYDIY